MQASNVHFFWNNRTAFVDKVSKLFVSKFKYIKFKYFMTEWFFTYDDLTLLFQAHPCDSWSSWGSFYIWYLQQHAFLLLQRNRPVTRDVCPIVMHNAQMLRFVQRQKSIVVKDHHILLAFVMPIEFVLPRIAFVRLDNEFLFSNLNI